MTTLQLASFILLWLVIIVEGALLLLLYRHVGLIYARHYSGLAVGTQAPPFLLVTARGVAVTLSEVLTGDYNLLVFGSYDCSGCRTLLLDHNISRFLTARAIPGYFLIKHSDVVAKDVSDPPLVVLTVDKRIFSDYGITATPFAYVVTRAGVVVARSLITEGAQSIELLCDEAHQRTHGSVQVPLQMAPTQQRSR